MRKVTQKRCKNYHFTSKNIQENESFKDNVQFYRQKGENVNFIV